MIAFLLGGALMLGTCIFIHELGHYLLARMVGIRARVFSIGYGRGIWSKQIGDTTWQVTAIPLGGYVKFYGDDYENPEKVPGGFFSAHPLKRIIPILGGPLFNLILGFLIFLLLHLFSGPPAPRIAIVEELGDQAPAYRDGLRDGDEVIAINDQSVRDFSDMMQIIALSEGNRLTFTIRRNGTELEKTVTPAVMESGVARIGIRQPGERRLQVTYPNFSTWTYYFSSIFGEYTPEKSIRAIPYLKDGDTILSVEGTQVHSVIDLQAVLGEHQGETVDITVERETLSWLAPWFTETVTVPVPSSPAYKLIFRDIVDEYYGVSLPDQELSSINEEYNRGLGYIRINGQEPGSFEALAERYPQPVSVPVTIAQRAYRATVYVERTGFLGFMPMPTIDGNYLDRHASAGAMLGAALEDTARNVMVYPAFFKGIFTGRVSFIENTAGPVKIFSFAGLAMKSDYRSYLQLFAMISIALFIMNLIPFPIVDGGHVVFCIYEAIAGKPLSPAVMETIYRMAFPVLLLFGLWIMYRDLIWVMGM